MRLEKLKVWGLFFLGQLKEWFASGEKKRESCLRLPEECVTVNEEAFIFLKVT
jgi:hypothetical protein